MVHAGAVGRLVVGLGDAEVEGVHPLRLEDRGAELLDGNTWRKIICFLFIVSHNSSIV